MGMNSNATASETKRVEIIDTPICVPISLSKKLSEKRKGRKIITVVSVAATIERQTSFVPLVTDLPAESPVPESR